MIRLLEITDRSRSKLLKFWNYFLCVLLRMGKLRSAAILWLFIVLQMDRNHKLNPDYKREKYLVVCYKELNAECPLFTMPSTGK